MTENTILWLAKRYAATYRDAHCEAGRKAALARYAHLVALVGYDPLV